MGLAISHRQPTRDEETGASVQRATHGRAATSGRCHRPGSTELTLSAVVLILRAADSGQTSRSRRRLTRGGPRS